MAVKAYLPELNTSLGVYLPLIVVNCIILGRAEMFASKHGVVDSALDGLGMGLGFTLTLVLMGTIREVLGSGSIFGLALHLPVEPMILFITPAGGFFVFGMLMAAVVFIEEKTGQRRERKAGCAGCPSAGPAAERSVTDNGSHSGCNLFSMILTNNYVLVKFLGICPFLGVSKRLDSAVGMSLAVTVVMAIATAVTWPLEQLLERFGLEYLQTIAFILVIATLVQLLELFLQKFIPPLYVSLGVYLPLITTNCAVLGVTILNIDEGYTYLESIVCAVGAGLGFLLAMVLFSGVRRRVEEAKPQKCFEGLPITLVSAAIVALSFTGFGGLVENIFGG